MTAVETKPICLYNLRDHSDLQAVAQEIELALKAVTPSVSLRWVPVVINSDDSFGFFRVIQDDEKEVTTP